MIIDSNSTLLMFFSNVLDTAEGERDLFDKLSPELQVSEQWIQDTFTGSAIYATYEGMEPWPFIKHLMGGAISYDALLRAVPRLDLFLTPNGFGVVSNQNVAPASKERVERLISNLERERDKFIHQLLLTLSQTYDWRDSEPFKAWSATLFPNLAVVENCGLKTPLYSTYLELRPRIEEIENEISANFVGDEQMQNFRLWCAGVRDNIGQTHHSTYLQVIDKLRTSIVRMLADNHPHVRLLQDAVNIIRNNPEIFPLWHTSPIHELFELPHYENKKDSHGYWF